MEAGEGGEESVMSGRDAVPVDLIKAASKRNRVEEDQSLVLGPTEETRWRWRVLVAASAGE